ncbi:hypothetical protein KL921_005103 [Ogataea angusta]|nr:hypothetical protein KL921_005103 [Ogataea angusta]
MKGIKKSKSGCLVCKRRKKKCDEAKPRCGHCQRLGLDCKYGIVLNWMKIQLHARFHASCARPPDHHLLNANFTSMGLAYHLLQMSPNCPVRVHNELWTAAVAEPCIDPRKTSPEYLFNHYVRNMSKSRSFCESTDTANEFLSIIVPLCKNFTALNQRFAELLLAVRPVQRRRHQRAAPDPGHVRPLEPRDPRGTDHHHHDSVRGRDRKHQQKLGQPHEGGVSGVLVAAAGAGAQLQGAHVCVPLFFAALRSARVHVKRRRSGATARLMPLAGH